MHCEVILMYSVSLLSQGPEEPTRKEQVFCCIVLQTLIIHFDLVCRKLVRLVNNKFHFNNTGIVIVAGIHVPMSLLSYYCTISCL